MFPQNHRRVLVLTLEKKNCLSVLKHASCCCTNFTSSDFILNHYESVSVCELSSSHLHHTSAVFMIQTWWRAEFSLSCRCFSSGRWEWSRWVIRERECVCVKCETMLLCVVSLLSVCLSALHTGDHLDLSQCVVEFCVCVCVHVKLCVFV